VRARARYPPPLLGYRFSVVRTIEVFRSHRRANVLRTMLAFLGCPHLGTRAAGTSIFFIALNSLGALSFDALMSPSIVEERLKYRTRLTPSCQAHARNHRKLHVVIGQGALSPIVHDEKQVGTVHRRIEVRCILQIIADVQ
jgi:hypothetical protein